MSPLESYFDRIFVVNLHRRTDRWAHVVDQMGKLGITRFERFEGYDKPLDHQGSPSGNKGCTETHRALLEIIVHLKIPRALILEDDFSIANTDPELKEFVDPQKLFAESILDLPEWDMLYLGGHYGEAPKYRISPRVIRVNGILTTSSYAVTWQQARRMAPYISGIGPIDSLYFGFNRLCRCFILQPRIFVQYPSHSDLTERASDNRHCMQDLGHERMV